MLIHVLQGERERAKDNWSLGRFTIDFESAPRGVARVGVQFEIDANGILHVLARDTRTGQQKIVEMKSAVDVDDSAVQKMVEESVEHAFDDMAARRWVEASLKANEVLAASAKALAECASELEPAYRSQVDPGNGDARSGERRFEAASIGERRFGRSNQAFGRVVDGQGHGSHAAEAGIDCLTWPMVYYPRATGLRNPNHRYQRPHEPAIPRAIRRGRPDWAFRRPHPGG
jgi:hypothetical protein